MTDSISLRKSGSLRRQLLLLLLGGLAIIWLGTAVLTVIETRQELDELLDAHLAQSAALLLAQAGEDVDDIEIEHAPNLHRHAQQVAFQIWDDAGRLQLHSANAPATPLSTTRNGYSDTRIGTQSWRVFSVATPDARHQIQVGESRAAREELAAEMLGQLLSPLLVALPLLGLLVWLAVTRALRPVRQLGDALSRQQPGQLHPLDTSVPRELVPLVSRLNELMFRVDASLDSERRFTSDASHELRTPLAAIRTQLQVAQGARDDAERERAITMALGAGERATRLIEQLLTLARVDHGVLASKAAPVNLRDVALQCIELLAPEAARKHVELGLDAVDSGTGNDASIITGHADLLQILLRNLIDNAIRYSPAGSSVTVHVAGCHNGTVTMSVCDEGPGIPQEQREAAMQRFRRLDTNGRQGSGLGLSIADRIATLHGATLTLSDGPDGKGLCVQIGFRR